MTSGPTTTQATSRGRMWLLWIAIFAGPAVWFVHLNTAVLLVPVACRMGSALPLHLNNLFRAAVTVWALAYLVRARRPHSPTASSLQPGGFLVFGGILVAAISLLLTVAEAIPVFFIDPCQ